MASSLFIIHIHTSNDKEQERKCFLAKALHFYNSESFLASKFHYSFLHHFSNRRRVPLKMKKTSLSKRVYQRNKVFSAWERLQYHKSACTDIFKNSKSKLWPWTYHVFSRTSEKHWRQRAHQTSNLWLSNLKQPADH